MVATLFIENFDNTLRFETVKGRVNEHIIRTKKPPRRSSKEKMSPADWDKLEKDIADAFGRT